MSEKWFTDIDKMGFTDEEKEIVEKVLDYTDTILYHDYNAYKTEDPSEVYYYNTKENLMENFSYTYTELKKEGVFDEEEDAPADPWLKVLEDRVEEWQDRFENQDYILKAEVKRFKTWVSKASEEELIYDTEFRYSTIKSSKEAYKYAWQMLGKSKDELAAYKETMNL